MNIIEPDYKTKVKACYTHKCSDEWPYKQRSVYPERVAAPGTLRQCDECGIWYFARQSSLIDSDYIYWHKVRWYHRHFKKRIKAHS